MAVPVQQRRCWYRLRDNSRLGRCAEIRTRKLPPGLLDLSLKNPLMGRWYCRGRNLALRGPEV